MAFEREIPCVRCNREFTETAESPGIEHPDAEPQPEPVCKACQRWEKRPRAGFVAAKERWRAV